MEIMNRALRIRRGTATVAMESTDTAGTRVTTRPPQGSSGRSGAARRAMPVAVRLAATYALIVAATLLVVAGLAYDLTRHQLASDLDERLHSAVATFERGTPQNLRSLHELAVRSRQWVSSQVVPPGGTIAVRTDGGRVHTAPGSLDLSAFPQGAALLHATVPRLENLQAGPIQLRALAVPLQVGAHPAGTLVVAGSIADAKHGLSALLFGIGWATALGVAMATLLGLLAVRRILRPLKRMSRSAEDIEATGDLSRRVGVTGPSDEVGRLATHFDGMLTKLEASFRSQQRFLSEASHELRTPITVARGRLELLQTRDHESVDAVLGELDRMARTVDHLLLLARLDEGMDLSIEPVEVELVMREALLRGMAEEPREATVDVEPDLFVLADHERLLQLLTNLVRNAVQHAGPDATLALTARGVDEEDLPHLFERFYRGAVARQHTPTGTGLGLPIVTSLVEAMHGRVSVDSLPGEGTTFTISLPRPQD